VRTVAIFNLADEPRSFTLNAKDLGLTGKDYSATDVWQSTTVPLRQLARMKLAAHESRLLTINAVTPHPQILDANLEITDVRQDGRHLQVAFKHAGQLELTLSAKPGSVSFEGKATNLKVSSGEGNWRLVGNLKTPGTLTFL